MQSLAQKKARENFKKAIEYRKKTGCSLKEAFAHVSGKKTVVKKKATLKKKAVKKVAVKKVAKKVYGTKKRKPISEKSILNKIHKVKKDVDNLDEAQHKHMTKMGAVSSHLIHEVKEAHNKLIHWQKALIILQNTRKSLPVSMKKYNTMDIKRVKEAIKEQKTHIAQLKKHIK